MVEKYRNIQLQYLIESCKVVPVFLTKWASNFPQMTVESQRIIKIHFGPCSGLLHSFHELQELCEIKEDIISK